MKRTCFYEWAIYWVVFILLTGWWGTAGAQNPDSLRNIVNHSRDDTGKVSLYAATSKAYKFSSADSVISFANKGIILADKLHYAKGRADCLVSLSVGCLIKFELDKGVSCCNEAIAIYGKTKDSADMAPAFFFMASIYYNLAKFNEAVLYYEQSARLSEKTKSYGLLGNTYNNIGNCYSALANYPEALNYFLKGLKVREKANDTAEIANSLGNIGQVYADMNDNTKAIAYVQQSIAMQKKTKDAMALMNNYENAGGVYSAVYDFKNAIIAFKEALHLADSAHMGGPQTERILCNLGEAYVEAGDYDKAYDVYSRCLADSALAANRPVEAMTQRGIGRVLVKRGDVKEGIAHMELAIKQFKAISLPRGVTETADELRKAYEQVHDYAHALEYTNMYYNYRDSLHNEKSDLRVQQLQFDYQLQKQKSQIELLKKNKVITQFRIWALVCGIVLLVIIIFLLFQSREHEKHSREMIEQQADNLDNLNQFKDKIFSVLSHDLSGPIGALSTTMALLEDNVISIEEFNELKPEMNKQLSSLTFLLDNLLKWSKNYLVGEKSVKPETLYLHGIAAQSIHLVSTAAEKKQVTIKNDVPENMTAKGDAGQVDIVIRNLVSNALKFTKPGGCITLSAAAEGNTVKISVADTGIGMTEEQLDKLFTTSSDNSTYGTGGEKGIGLGLLLCYEFIKGNNGTITATSELGKGSTFIIELPKA